MSKFWFDRLTLLQQNLYFLAHIPFWGLMKVQAIMPQVFLSWKLACKQAQSSLASLLGWSHEASMVLANY
jgi:hypothetical protein